MWAKIVRIVCVPERRGYVSISFFSSSTTLTTYFSARLCVVAEALQQGGDRCAHGARYERFGHFSVSTILVDRSRSLSIVIDRDRVVLTHRFQVRSFSRRTRVRARCRYRMASHLANRSYVPSSHLCVYAHNDSSDHADITFMPMDDITFPPLPPNSRYYRNHGSIQRSHLHPGRLFVSVSLYSTFQSTLT